MQLVRSVEAEWVARVGCSCDAEKIQAVHRYLNEHFSGYVLADFHAPTKLIPAGSYANHHVVRITRADILPYYAVLLNECQEHCVLELEKLLRQSDLAGALRANRIAIVAKNGASSL